ncbi:hypothetical protein EDB19DRAFT_1744979 [Suillus lakei]|nr:hypothetical protein EDB19DRAFT_1744979 [Suillus lakei]
MILTLIPAVQNWRMTNGRLYFSLTKHNIFYYTCGLSFSVANIFTSLLLHYAYHAMLHDFQSIVLAILATRMHRHLWQVNRRARGSSALVHISMSENSSVDVMA